jgi:hypothetical protein
VAQFSGGPYLGRRAAVFSFPVRRRLCYPESMSNRIPSLVVSSLLLTALALAGAGCEGEPPANAESPRKEATKPEEAKKVLVGKNIFFEIQGTRRRVILSTYVCLREGPLEQLLTRKEKKEHEAILAIDGDGRDIHKALLAAGAKPGKTVQYQPKFLPPTGQRIKVTLEYEQDGKRVEVPAQQWVRNQKTGKAMDLDWVFAGSQFVANPFDPKAPDIYLANEGDVICVSNFEGALLDLPINSPKDNSQLAWEAFTERIPPRGTKVAILLEPLPDKK